MASSESKAAQALVDAVPSTIDTVLFDMDGVLMFSNTLHEGMTTD
jgi:ribonucleotide monophosphatase NagD (HAD superfamily)